MTESYKHLVDKLNAYIGKYYFYQLLKGIIYFIILLISYFTVLSVTEYYLFLSVPVRTILFFTSLVLFLIIGLFYFILPFLKLLGLSKRMEYEKAAYIISKHFNDIDDRLLNIIELSKLNDKSDQSLIWASIDEKIDKIKLIDFSKAVVFKKLISKIVILTAAVFLAVVLYFTFPGLFTDTSQRLFAYKTAFVKPAPFTYELLNDSLKVKKGDELTLSVKCKGAEIPDFLYVNIAGSHFMMNKKDNTFSYKLDRVNNSFSVYFTNLTYQSRKYSITVLPAPVILSYQVEIDPPTYTSFEKRKENMLGDLEVPYGSKIRWTFQTVDTDSLLFNLNKKTISTTKTKRSFSFDYLAKSNLSYSISIKNEDFDYKDLLNFEIKVSLIYILK